MIHVGSMTPDEQIAYSDTVTGLVNAADPEAVRDALLRGLVAAHGPRPETMQCLPMFSTNKQDGCSLCSQYGSPIRVEGRDWLKNSVWHVHLPPDPTCITCGVAWPCAVIETIRAVLR
jgi:hypothetical protein